MADYNPTHFFSGSGRGLKWLGRVLPLVVCLLASAVRAENSLVEQLYTLFLADPGDGTFVSFEHEVLIPERHNETRQVKLANGKTAELHLSGKDYYAFMKAGDHFLAAHSARPVVTNLSGIMQADQIVGYDGNDYWEFDPGAAVKMHVEKSSNSPASDVDYGRLTVVHPDSRRTGTNLEPALMMVKGLAYEGYCLTYLGCAYPLAVKPVIEDGNRLKLVDPLSKPLLAELKFQGGSAPSEIKYLSTNIYFDVGLDSAQNAVSIKYIYTNKVFRHTVYRLSSVASVPQADADKMFSWQSFAGSKKQPHLLAFLVDRGITSQAEIRDGELMPVAKLYRTPPPGNPGAGPRRAVVVILVALTGIGTALIAKLGKTKTT
jgi:hypothetical protein